MTNYSLQKTGTADDDNDVPVLAMLMRFMQKQNFALFDMC